MNIYTSHLGLTLHTILHHITSPLTLCVPRAPSLSLSNSWSLSARHFSRSHLCPANCSFNVSNSLTILLLIDSDCTCTCCMLPLPAAIVELFPEELGLVSLCISLSRSMVTLRGSRRLLAYRKCETYEGRAVWSVWCDGCDRMGGVSGSMNNAITNPLVNFNTRSNHLSVAAGNKEDDTRVCSRHNS